MSLRHPCFSDAPIHLSLYSIALCSRRSLRGLRLRLYAKTLLVAFLPFDWNCADHHSTRTFRRQCLLVMTELSSRPRSAGGVAFSRCGGMRCVWVHYIHLSQPCAQNGHGHRFRTHRNAAPLQKWKGSDSSFRQDEDM